MPLPVVFKSLAAVVLTVGMLVGCGSPDDRAASSVTQQIVDPDCPDVIGGRRIPLQPVGNPPPDVSKLVLCSGVIGTRITNGTDQVWLVDVPSGVTVNQSGDVPLDVQAFRGLGRRGTVPGYFVEPGTSVYVVGGAEKVRLVIDPQLQVAWSTFVLVRDTLQEQTQERLPDLLTRNEQYRRALGSCIDAGSSAATVIKNDARPVEAFVDRVGLVSGTSRCAVDLNAAERERQAIRARAGLSTRPLPTSAFLDRARSSVSGFDDLVKHLGKLAQIAAR